MNKVETKKHWYDKPIKFIFFLASLLPFTLFIFNFVCVQSRWETVKTEVTRVTGDTTTIRTIENMGENGYNYNNIFQINDTTLINQVSVAMFYTNKQLTGSEYSDTNDVTIEENGIMVPIFLPAWFKDFFGNLFLNETLVDKRDAIVNNYLISPYTFLTNILIWESWLTIIYIFLRIILFLPSVICYVLDWIERRLGKL